MPAISTFFGIVVEMFWREHGPPHFHATYAEHAKILEAIQHKRGDQAALLLRSHIQTSQAEVRKITLHQLHMARQAVC